MKKVKHRGIDSIKKRYGLIMVSPWIFGMLVFFIIPIFQSICFSFSDVGLGADGLILNFTKLSNYVKLLKEDPNYVKFLISDFRHIFISLPLILIVSVVLALLLNGKYKGRIFFRGIFFMPAIISSGIVLRLYLTAVSAGTREILVSDTVSFGMMFDFTKLLSSLNLPEFMSEFLSLALSNIFMLVWQSGIQTILVIAGLQSISDLLYEVAKVEGATKWQEFWFITVPMLGRNILLVIIFTVVELATDNSKQIIAVSYSQMKLLKYGIGSAMLWFYFMIVGIVVAIMLFLYNRFFLKRWS